VSIYVLLSGHFDAVLDGYKEYRPMSQSLSRIPTGTSLPVVLNYYVIRQGYGRTANLLLGGLPGSREGGPRDGLSKFLVVG
jgi:hypothetical protein